MLNITGRPVSSANSPIHAISLAIWMVLTGHLEDAMTGPTQPVGQGEQLVSLREGPGNQLSVR